jgi:hypothetical protein
MHRSRSILLSCWLCFALFAGGDAGAQRSQSFLSGNELYGMLRDALSGGGSVDTSIGLGYLMGTAMALNGLVHPESGRRFCLEQQVVARQLIEIVHDHLRANPADRNRNAVSLIVEALSEQYPCR